MPNAGKYQLACQENYKYLEAFFILQLCGLPPLISKGDDATTQAFCNVPGHKQIFVITPNTRASDEKEELVRPS